MKDILFINPGDRKVVFQDLGKNITAIEPPYLTLSFATYLKSSGFSAEIIDANAENISPEEVTEKAKSINPKLIAIIVYGNQPSASTQNMSISGKIASVLKKSISTPIVMAGLHPSALPERTITEEDVDFVIEGEEQISLSQLLEHINGDREITDVEGLWYRHEDSIKNNPKGALIKDLNRVMPIADWDMLPMERYRAHNWHCFDNIEERAPYAAIYTSLGCPFRCNFCCINAPFGKPGIRYRDPHIVVEELEILNHRYNVRNIKFIDEMFVLHEKHYMKIVDLIIEKELDLNIWCYARVDTIKRETLARMKKAGINWLALGIESANSAVRDGALKKMKTDDIKAQVRDIQNAGIRVIGNYIFGLPGDTLESMQETLDMAKELNCEFANMYCAMAYPGSEIYNNAVINNSKLPDVWHGYSQHSYEVYPLATENLTSAEIVKFRDDAFHEYYSNPVYLDMLENKFGKNVRTHIEEVTEKRLSRRLLEPAQTNNKG